MTHPATIDAAKIVSKLRAAVSSERISKEQALDVLRKTSVHADEQGWDGAFALLAAEGRRLTEG